MIVESGPLMILCSSTSPETGEQKKQLFFVHNALLAGRPIGGVKDKLQP